ncbi:MAG: nucleotidyltransferase [Clostridia bacterium]|nr:nucleotidyltransferase [Clostridia bacterium]
MTLFILAAGMGSRYGGLKQIDPFTKNGEFIIDFSIYDAIQAGFERVVFVIKEENYEAFHETIGARVEGKIKVEYVFQKMDKYVPADKIPADRVKPWGTTHAVLCGKEALHDGFVVINADDFYGRDAFMKAAEFLKNVDGKEGNKHFCMVGYMLGNTLTDNGSVARGICDVTDGYLTKIVERTKLYKEEGGAYFEEGNEKVHVPNETVVSMNFWGFTPEIFAGLEEDFIKFLADPDRDPLKSESLLPNTVFTMMQKDMCDVAVLTTTSKWFGVTYSEDKPEVIAKLSALIAEGVYPDGLWK